MTGEKRWMYIQAAMGRYAQDGRWQQVGKCRHHDQVRLQFGQLSYTSLVSECVRGYYPNVLQERRTFHRGRHKAPAPPRRAIRTGVHRYYFVGTLHERL